MGVKEHFLDLMVQGVDIVGFLGYLEGKSWFDIL